MDAVTPKADVQDEPSAADAQAVSRRLAEINHAVRHFERDFAAMAEDMAFARGLQWGGDKQGYVVNFTLRHIQTRTAALYAKNPQVVAKRRARLETRFWDGSASQLIQAQQSLAMAAQGGAIDPQAQSILREAAEIAPKRELLDRIGRTLALILEYFLDTGIPSFKESAKQCVRQALTCGVGFAKIGYRRPGQGQPDMAARSFDVLERSAALAALSPESDEDGIQAQTEAFAASLYDAAGQAVWPEGLVFTFPPATSVICDVQTRSLLGLQGTRWLAERFYLQDKDIEALYGVKLASGDYRRHKLSDAPFAQDMPTSAPGEDRAYGDAACVYEVWDRERGTVETVCDGYRGYLRRPAAPTVRVNGFFPYHALLFNDVADDRRIYPPSDVSLLRDMQLDTNLARQGVREHRIANRPRQIVRNGAFEEEDQKKLAGARAHDVILVNAPGDTPLQNLIEPVPTIAISPELYSTVSAERDMLLSVGSQEANIGPVSGATATEVGVAEASRQTAMGSQIDDMDLWLSHIMRSAGQILLAHMPQARALEIAGPAAAWPCVQVEDYAQELTLAVRAGSSGKPNRALEIANFERLGPLLMQIPGINPLKLAEELLSRLGDGLDLAELIDPAAPSIIARNAALNAGPALSSGNAASAAPDLRPEAQAGEGAFNLPAGIGRPGGPQPGYPGLPSTGVAQ